MIVREAPATQASEILRRVAAWLEKLNADEVARRVEVNERHLAERGRALYPEGGQYATFTLGRPGRRYTRVEMRAGGQTSVHAFVDLNTGDVYKAAGWRAPAAGVRFNLADDESYASLLARCDWAGGYLYR